MSEQRNSLLWIKKEMWVHGKVESSRSFARLIFNGNSTAESDFLDRIFGVQDISVGDLMLTEVLQGFRSDKDYKTAKSIIGDFDVVDILGRERAISAASKYRSLRKAGVTVRKTNDVIIASYCIDEKIPLLFSDKDFEPIVKDLGLLTAIRGI